jgi:hypothetical protein
LVKLVKSDTARVVAELQNLDQNSKQIMADLLTSIAKAEHARDPKRGSDVLGEIIGAVAIPYAEEASRPEPRLAHLKSLGMDLGYVYSSTVIAIGTVADDERKKIQMGADILRFVTNALAASGIPGASKIGK